ncbi:MAG: o-succinylbenzoate synthase [Thermosynechococcaceae cyanobacterium]
MGQDSATPYTLHLKPYRRRFLTPLQTHHGLWRDRTGLLVGLQPPKGRIGWGEIAPIPWFGTETLEAAIAYCQQLPSALTEADIFAIPDTLPCCQFGWGSAWEALHHPSQSVVLHPHQVSGLLPTGEAALSLWSDLWAKGYRTFKWKIGVAPVEQELALFHRLMETLPRGTTLRLDANGGLTWAAAKQWLDHCDALIPGRIEYLEQPLPPNQLEEMVQLAQAYRTPLALDESVATLSQLRQCYDWGWPGVMAIKPAIAGYPQALRSFLQTHLVDAVFSSALETEVGCTTALCLGQAFNRKGRALGFGVDHWFAASDDDRMQDVESIRRNPF